MTKIDKLNNQLDEIAVALDGHDCHLSAEDGCECATLQAHLWKIGVILEDCMRNLEKGKKV